MHLRLPTSFCAPNFAWLMVSDARDARRRAARRRAGGRSSSTTTHDSDLINAGLAADAGYRGTFGHEAEESLDELRATFQRKAHTAAMERALTGWLRADPARTEAAVGDLRAGRPAGRPDDRGAAAAGGPPSGLPVDPASPVLLAPDGSRPPADAVAATLRRARSVRISVDGNAHFCRGLLGTRYPGAEADQTPRPSVDARTTPLLPLEVLS